MAYDQTPKDNNIRKGFPQTISQSISGKNVPIPSINASVDYSHSNQENIELTEYNVSIHICIGKERRLNCEFFF